MLKFESVIPGKMESFSQPKRMESVSEAKRMMSGISYISLKTKKDDIFEF